MVKKQKTDGRLVCAICASPAVALETYGVLKGETATCYPVLKNFIDNKM